VQEHSWKLEDAQILANEFPYTFYKPSSEVVSLLKEGNEVKLIFEFESDDPEAPQAERMWVEIKEIKNGKYVGTLDNDPAYINDLNLGDTVEFEERHIVDTDLDDPIPSITKKHIKCCFVTNRILYNGEKIGYFYREEPDQEDDSGWRFLVGDETDEYMDDSENISYVSLGAVLREDDSVVEFLESPVNTYFGRDEKWGFIELE
jgi:hypothetical protein